MLAWQKPSTLFRPRPITYIRYYVVFICIRHVLLEGYFSSVYLYTSPLNELVVWFSCFQTYFFPAFRVSGTGALNEQRACRHF